MNKKIPVLRTLGRSRELDELKDSVFWINLVLGLVAGASLFMMSFLVQPIYASALRIVALIVVLQMVFVFYFSLLRADSRFDLVSKGIAGLSIFSSILVLLVAYLSPDRLLGALCGLAAAYPFVILYWFFKGGYTFTSCLKGSRVKDAFGIGFPLILLGLIDMMLMSLDRWIIAWKLPETALGFYALGIMACNLLGLVPTSAANVLYPRMLERFAATQDYRAVRGLLLNPVRAVAAVMIFLISAMAIAVPVVIRMLLPKYVPAIPLIDILLPGAYFLAIAPIAGSYVVSVNLQRGLIKVQLVAIGVCLVLDGILLYAGYGVRGIAYGTLCCYAIYGYGYLGIAVYLAQGSWRETLRFLVQLFTLFVVMAVALKGTALFSSDASRWTDQAFSAGLRLFVVSGVLLPFVWLVNRKSGMLSTLRTEFAGWRSTKTGKE
jgi:O-antigen/teichoic acid export membrane protein